VLRYNFGKAEFRNVYSRGSSGQFRRWRDELQLPGNDAFPGQSRIRDQELTELKRELAKVKKERDFLKEAAAYFAKESR
jgi:transposase